MWNYEIVDNFFNQEDYQLLRDNILKVDTSNLGDSELLVESNKMYKDGRMESKSFDKELLSRLDKSYTPILVNSLKKIAPKKLKFFDFAEFNFAIGGKNYKHHVHEDDYRKLLSVVVFLHPKKNIGTNLFLSKKKEGTQEIEWKENRALIFSRIEGKTWHDFGSDGLSKRYTLIYNLRMTDGDREFRNKVLQAEGTFARDMLYKILTLPFKPLLQLLKFFKIYKQIKKYFRN